MAAINFTRFVDKVEGGTKRCTIRRHRKRPVKVGEPLHLYTGMRTKACRKLRQEICRSTTPLIIEKNRVVLKGKELAARQIRKLAHDDGYENLADFWTFFVGRKRKDPFEGNLIKW